MFDIKLKMPLSIFPVQCKLHKIEKKKIEQLDRMLECFLEGGQQNVLPPF